MIGKENIDFPRAWLEKDQYDFSFSGLKSAVINKIHNAKQRDEKLKKEDIAASFQASVIEVLVEKTYQAALEYEVKQVIVAEIGRASCREREEIGEEDVEVKQE